MPVDLPLETMSLAEKLDAMERLWSDIAKKPGEVPSPDWHQDVLTERKRLVSEGKLKFVDWETTIAQLRENAGENPAT